MIKIKPHVSGAPSPKAIGTYYRTDAYYWSFFLHSTRQWNNLPKNSSKLLGIQFNDVLSHY